MADLAMVGLGKMGANMARRLRRAEISLILYDQDESLTNKLSTDISATPAKNLEEAVSLLRKPRRVWLMLPAGTITETCFQSLKFQLEPGDTLIDGANSFYKDSQRRAVELREKGVGFVDVGVSGGIWGEKNGYSLMFGGEKAYVEPLMDFFRALAPSPEKGWVHCGPAGSGHFTKMIHNGIEYGMMQAFAEGLNLMKQKNEFSLDLASITAAWQQGSVVRSWLLDLIQDFLNEDSSLEEVAPFVADSGEGRWTALESIEQGISTPVMTSALFSRFSSQGKDDFAWKLLSKMRQGFGGHEVKKK